VNLYLAWLDAAAERQYAANADYQMRYQGLLARLAT
jgi:hypothetical protein